LENNPDAPSDLRQKALRLAGRIIEFDPDVRGGHGFDIARDILDSGRALAKMNDIIETQGRQDCLCAHGSLTYDVKATNKGFVTGIDNLQIARIASIAGAPLDKGAGIDLFKKLGDPVEEGELLYRIHAEFNSDFQFSCELARTKNGYNIGAKEEIPKAYVD
ncbi:MAG: thymidine phosphorylase, partial [Calditrichia bacterium]|nr:thymidine phosphorylase [Calditrichia bacterium]